MKKVRFTKTTVVNGKIYMEGWVAGFRDSVANNLLLTGKAKEAHPNARLLKYAPEQKVSIECVVDTNDLVESAPKGATTEPEEREVKAPKTNTYKK